MKLILNSDVQSLGRKGDVVDVAKGYARNYLLPKKLAIVATANNLEFAKKLQEKRQEQAQINSELAESIKTALADAHIVISQTSTDEGTLYAAINNEQITQAVETFSGFKLEEDQINVENQVKEIGLHTVKVVLGPDTSFDITFAPQTKLRPVARTPFTSTCAHLRLPRPTWTCSPRLGEFYVRVFHCAARLQG